MDNKQKCVQNEESASFQPRQSTNLASQEEKEEVNLDVIKLQESDLLTQVKKSVKKSVIKSVKKVFNSSPSKLYQFDSDQLAVEKAMKKHQDPELGSWKHPYNRADERRSTEIKNTFTKSHNPSIDGGRQEKEEIRVQDFNLENNDASGISLPIEYKNSLEDSSFSDHATQSRSAEIKSTSKKSHIPRCDGGRLGKEGMRVQSNHLEQDDANGSLDGQGVYRNTVPAQSSKLQEGRPSSGLAADSINTNYRDASSKYSYLTALLATSACSEQSCKPINASKKPSSNGKSQNMKGKLEVVASVERVPQTSVVLQSDPSCYPSNLPNADFTDCAVLESNQHGRKSHADLTTEPLFLDSSGHHESTNVELENVNLENFQNQLLFISREEQKYEHDIFAVKGNVISNRLRNLPKEQAKEAEKQIACILYQSEVDAGQGKSQTGNIHNPYIRRPLYDMCEENLSPSQGSSSSRKEKKTGVGSPNIKKIYPQLPQEELNGDLDEQENTEPVAYDQNLRSYDADSENLLDEQESDEEVVTVNTSVSPIKGVPYVKECAKWHDSRKKPKQHKEKISPKPPPSYTYMKVLCALLAILCAVAAAAIFGTPFGPKILKMFSKMNTPHPIDVAAIIENLKGEFSEQPPMTFKIVTSAIRRVTEPDPKEPAIIVLLAEQGAEEIASHLARKIAKSVTSSDDIVLISGHTYRNEDHDTAKKDIDILISENLREDELGAVLIERLDYIPAEAAMIFHTYCDHENAPFKRAVYVMTIASKKTQLKLHEPKDWDTMVQEHLYKSWSTGGNDQISSLLSRLTVSVAAIVSGV